MIMSHLPRAARLVDAAACALAPQDAASRVALIDNPKPRLHAGRQDIASSACNLMAARRQHASWLGSLCETSPCLQHAHTPPEGTRDCCP
jgi:hypothetical protein